MATSADIRAKVDRGNSLVAEAQYAMRLASDKLSEARVAYLSIQTSKLDAAVGSIVRSQDEIDEALKVTFAITAQADIYAAGV